MSKRLIEELAALYPMLHLVVAPGFMKYAPEPAPGKSWYAVIYHAVEYFSLGNGKADKSA